MSRRRWCALSALASLSVREESVPVIHLKHNIQVEVRLGTALAKAVNGYVRNASVVDAHAYDSSLSSPEAHKVKCQAIAALRAAGPLVVKTTCCRLDHVKANVRVEQEALMLAKEEGSKHHLVSAVAIGQWKTSVGEHDVRVMHMVMPKAAGGTLEDHIMPNAEGNAPCSAELLLTKAGPGPTWNPIPVALQWSVLHQIVTALEFMHGEGLVHGDVKPSNILLDSRGRAMLSDFGSVNIKGTKHGANGTPLYMAPEVMVKFIRRNRKAVRAAEDMWSLGVVIYIMHTGVHPQRLLNTGYGHPTRRSVLVARTSAIRCTKAPLPKYSPPLCACGSKAYWQCGMLQLADSMLCTAPSQRLSSAQAASLMRSG